MIPSPFINTTTTVIIIRCTIDNLNDSLTRLIRLILPLRRIIKDMGGTAGNSRLNNMVVEGTKWEVEGLREVGDILDMHHHLLRRGDHHLVRIRSFGIGFRRWIRIGLDLSL